MSISSGSGKFIQLADVSLYHIDLGGGGKPVLLLHGNGEDHTSLLPLGRALARKCHVHLLDSRNHGRSDRHPDVSYRAMAGDVIAFLAACAGQVAPASAPQQQAGRGDAALAGQGGMALVGYSDGAIIALLVALARPDLVSRLVLMGPNLSPDDFTPEARAWIETEWQQTGNPLMRLMLTEPDIPLTDLAHIPHPAWVVAGEDDACPRAVFERIAAHLPRGRLTVLPGHNHHSYVFGSDELAEPLLAFLAETD